MSELDGPPNQSNFSERPKFPTAEEAQADKEKFLELAQKIEKGDADTEDVKKAKAFVAVAEERANSILQEAGKIPEDDPRFEVFDCYNQIAAEWNRLVQLRKIG